MDVLPSSAAWSKIRPDFTIVSGLKIEVTEKSYLQKMCAFSMKKKIREIRMIFDIENSL